MYNVFVWKIENLLNTAYHRIFVLLSLIVLFLLLSNNTLHIMFYTYICYWNTFQYKYIIQITFHVVKQTHARVTSKDTCLLFIIFIFCQLLFCLDFVLFHEALLLLCCFISWSSSPPLLFNWPRVLLYLKVSNHIYILKWYIIQCLIYFVFAEC